MNQAIDLADRKRRIAASVAGRLEIESELQLDRDLAAAKTHADLDRIEDQMENAEEADDEEDLFDD